MPEPLLLLIFSVLVVIAVALFRRYAVAAVDMGALFVTILACIIAAGIETWLAGWSTTGFLVATFIIYAVSNLIFQMASRLTK